MLPTNRRRILFAALLAAVPIAAAAAQDGSDTVIYERGRQDRSATSRTPGLHFDVPLIPRRVLFDNPQRTAPRISHDGRHIAYLAPVNGVLNVWVAPIDNIAEAKPVTSDTNRGIRSYSWAHSNEHVLYIQDKGGDENWRVYRTDIATGETRDLTPYEGVNARIEEVSHKRPNEIVIGVNNRVPQFHDLHVVNVVTGEKTTLIENPGMINGGVVQGFLVDDDYTLRYASTISSTDGSTALLAPDGSAAGGWSTFLTAPMADSLTTFPIGFDSEKKFLYMIDSRDRNTAALVSIELATGKKTRMVHNDHADAGAVMMHPTTGRPQAVQFNYDKPRWQIADLRLVADFNAFEELHSGVFSVVSRTLDDQRWVVAFADDVGPTNFYLWDRKDRRLTHLFVDRTDIAKYTLAPMRPVVINSRDGLELMSYLTIPANTQARGEERPDNPLPMVLLVHGGPWARDSWGFNPSHQMLANRGYAVLSVNFRGSTGFGKEFLNAGNREWAAKMHDDLIDAVNWAVSEKIADPERVAIMGGSYGGYATLVGLTFTPDVFACGVDIVGPSNIVTLLETIPPYWAPAVRMFKDRVGDHTTPEGRAFLEERSPLTHVDKIRKPLLIAQGANDPRVKQAESDQIVHAMTSKNIPVTYVLYPDEGHGFARPENRLSFYAVTDAFLSKHLGGRFEPISGEEVESSTITVPTGAAGVPGLTDLLPDGR